jgi:glycosyltransferase involved in cell wall biosynthesis
MGTLASIIIRTFNDEKTILSSLHSALKQSFSKLEIIIINDGSTDKTGDIIKSVFDSRLRFIEQENSGPISAAYTGLENAKGEWITFLDADDELAPDAIKYLSKPLYDNTYSYSYCDYLENNMVTGIRKYVSLSNFYNILACGIMFNRRIIENISFWDKKFILPEYDFIFRVRKKYKGKHIKMPLYKYNRHPNSLTSNKKLIENAKEQIFSKYGKIHNFKKY